MRGTGILLLILLGATRLAAQDSLRVLFVGNSHTYVNNLPALVAGLAATGGHPLLADQSAVGGATLCQHAQNPATLARIQSRAWDRVVLQEQSQVPVIPWWRQTCMVPAAVLLDSLIRQQGAQTLLFMTWGWEAGGQQCYADSCSIIFRDYQHMQDSVSTSYRRLAQQLSCGLAPVGEVWSQVLQADPFAPLWAADGYHPALEGSYLAACAFYLELFGESPVGLAFTAGLDPARALWLQEQALDALALPAPSGLQPQELEFSAYPNPFNPATVLRYRLDRAGPVRLEVSDLRGRRVALLLDGMQAAGAYEQRFQAESLPTGLYFCTLQADGRRETRKVLLQR